MEVTRRMVGGSPESLIAERQNPAIADEGQRDGRRLKLDTKHTWIGPYLMAVISGKG
jgi:hypothetical protein